MSLPKYIRSKWNCKPFIKVSQFISNYILLPYHPQSPNPASVQLANLDGPYLNKWIHVLLTVQLAHPQYLFAGISLFISL